MFMYLLLGTVFGFILSRSGASDYDYIQAMFLFEDFQLYGIIATAVALTAPGIWLVRRSGRSTPEIQRRSFNRGNIAGGFLFGVGWSIAGMCPGPIFVNIGEGKIYALSALAGALIGAGSFGVLYGRLQRVFGLPPIVVGTSQG